MKDFLGAKRCGRGQDVALDAIESDLGGSVGPGAALDTDGGVEGGVISVGRGSQWWVGCVGVGLQRRGAGYSRLCGYRCRGRGEEVGCVRGAGGEWRGERGS